jgi:hypothetical protein
MGTTRVALVPSSVSAIQVGTSAVQAKDAGARKSRSDRLPEWKGWMKLMLMGVVSILASAVLGFNADADSPPVW